MCSYKSFVTLGIVLVNGALFVHGCVFAMLARWRKEMLSGIQCLCGSVLGTSAQKWFMRINQRKVKKRSAHQKWDARDAIGVYAALWRSNIFGAEQRKQHIGINCYRHWIITNRLSALAAGMSDNDAAAFRHVGGRGSVSIARASLTLSGIVGDETRAASTGENMVGRTSAGGNGGVWRVVAAWRGGVSGGGGMVAARWRRAISC